MFNFMTGKSNRGRISASPHQSNVTKDDNTGPGLGQDEGLRRSDRVADSHAQAIAVRDDEIRQRREIQTRLKAECDKTKTTLYHVRKERDGLKKKKELLNLKYECFVNKIVLPYANNRGLRWNDSTLQAMEPVLGRLHYDAMNAEELREQTHKTRNGSLEATNLREEVRALREENSNFRTLHRGTQMVQEEQTEVENLRKQVQMLQNDLLARVVKVETATDDHLAQEFRTIAALVKSISRSVQLSGDANISSLLKQGALFADVAQHCWNTRARKKSFVEAWIWDVLLGMVFNSPFRIFKGDGEKLSDMWMRMFGIDHFQYWPLPSTQSEFWRHTTVERLVELVGRNVITHGEIDQSIQSSDPHVQKLQTEIVKARHEVAYHIRSSLCSISQTVDFSQMESLIKKSFSLALEMATQRCRLQITFPAVGAGFNEDCMCSIPDRNGEDMSSGVVAFIINPGLTKWGDASGQKLDQRYDIVPSLVQLEMADRKFHPQVEIYSCGTGYSAVNSQADEQREDTMPAYYDNEGEPIIKQESE